MSLSILVKNIKLILYRHLECAKTLNDGYRQRAILLTARELEPYHIYERIESEFNIQGHGGTPEDLALATVQMYFRERPDGIENGSA